jgi:hypothetical protein
VSPQAEGIVVRLHFTHQAQITSASKNVSESSAFTDIQYQGTMAGSGKNDIATTNMQQR